MFYGYIEGRDSRCFIITKPCASIEEAAEARDRAVKSWPRAVQICHHGGEYGVMKLKYGDPILIPENHIGIWLHFD